MSTNVRPIPEGYRSLSPALTCKNAARAIDFTKTFLAQRSMHAWKDPAA